ncbi:hypothetical protein POTG_02620 [Paenibacillus sp. oral taxon 786 str. D14]|uniref:DUF6470 family protein n=1 Tax=Paenibacillus sp. oral taxon 786 TaxID=652715 RepID=UPI0001AFD730|nr:DUF6470 family protein [Paenibacillus sp. oral taxon 786]EES72673.1 hypothetical protein POTG_02620 [Paenibacillus sp. oral taxon 786 str. D14]
MRAIGSDLPADWGKYRPAELTIHLTPPEMEADWTGVYEDLGLKRPSSLLKELNQENQRAILENISSKAREGDRIARIQSGEKNVFGQIAFERYMRNGQKELTIDALPKHGVVIDFRIYPPEIHVNPRGALPK